jgi:hypothetical protein
VAIQPILTSFAGGWPEAEPARKIHAATGQEKLQGIALRPSIFPDGRRDAGLEPMLSSAISAIGVDSKKAFGECLVIETQQSINAHVIGRGVVQHVSLRTYQGFAQIW